MKFDNRGWKLDINNLWWNANRINIRDSLLKHFRGSGGPALLTGMKGAGKTTLASYLSKKIPAPMIRLRGYQPEELIPDEKIVIIDEAQKITLEERKDILNKNRNTLMVSVSEDLTNDGIYKVMYKVDNLTREELASYINFHKSLDLFEVDGLDELYKASRGITRLVNLICREAIEQYHGLITRAMIEQVAKRKFKLRY